MPWFWDRWFYLAAAITDPLLLPLEIPTLLVIRMWLYVYLTLPYPAKRTTATEKQAVIHLVDIAGITSSSAADYSSKNLYLWNNETCDALSAPVADWNDVSTTPSGSDKYGPYWVIPLNKESGCINVIVRDGTDKLIDSDLRVSFGDFTDRTVSVIAGNSAVYDSRADAFRAAFGVALVPKPTGSIKIRCCGRAGRISPSCASTTATAVKWR